MPRIIAFDWLLIIIVQLFLLNFVGAEKKILKCMIKDGENEIHLNLKETNQLLANKNLPIWIAKAGTPTSCRFNTGALHHDLLSNFMEEHIGDFTAYHDEEKSAAIIYFKKTGTLHGTIDTRYVISGMPLNECSRGHQAGEAYVKRSKGYMDIHESVKLRYPLIPHNEKTSTPQSEPSTSTQYQAAEKIQKVVDNSDKMQMTTFYPEVLVFVTKDVIEHIKKNGKLKKIHLSTIVKHYIIYFNGVDMLLAKLSTNNIKIHLNLAGIVIESRDHLFPFIKVSESTPPKIDSKFTIQTMPDYLIANNNIFPDDSFDFYFVSTGWQFTLVNDVEICNGVSTDPDDLDIFEERQEALKDRYTHGSIVHQGIPCEYVTAAHEIAHLLGVKHDPRGVGYTNGYDQCYAIMQEVGQFCTDCLKWSDRSIQNFKKYARENRNRCFLLNSPRSLLPRGHPIKTLLPSEQCRCYGFERRPIISLTDYLDEISSADCNEKLICSDGSNSVSTVLPLDGTPCGDNKVCWDRICKDLSPVPSSLLEEGNVI